MLTLLAVALAAHLWRQDLEVSLASYASPIHAPLPQGAATTPLVGQVVMVVARGLTTSTLQEMPFLESLARQGATASLALDPNARIIDILTGAAPDLSRTGAGGVAPETIFATLRRISGVSVLAGGSEWLTAAGPAITDGLVAPAGDDAGDEAVVKHVLGRLDFWLPDLVLAAIRGPVVVESTEITETTGTTEPAPVAPPASDGRVKAVWQMMQTRSPGNAVLLVMGDSDGAPIVLTGRAVQAGRGGELTPGDLTLTVAALLGAPFPSSSSGRIQFPILVMSDAVQAEKQLAMAQQREALADGYLPGIGSDATSSVVEGDLVVARSALVARNFDSAFRLASHSLSQADAELVAGRAALQESERRSRLPFVGVMALPLLYGLISLLAAVVARSSLATAMGLAPRRMLRPWRPQTVIGVITGAAAWGSFQWLAPTQPLWTLLIWVLGVGGLLVWIAAVWADRLATLAVERRGRTPKEAAKEAARVPSPVALCGFGLVFTYLAGLLPVSIYYAQGRLVTWFLPDPASIVLLGESTGLLYVVALLVTPLPVAGAILNGLAGSMVWIWERWRAR